MAYKNPAPVVVGLVFPKPRELLVVRRGIAPNIGELALPGGYVNLGEDWREALAREIREEATITVSTNPKYMKVYDVRSTPDGEKILIFAVVSTEGVKKMHRFKRNKEVSERLLIPVGDYFSDTLRLCFPLHTAIVKKYCDENVEVPQNY